MSLLAFVSHSALSVSPHVTSVILILWILLDHTLSRPRLVVHPPQTQECLEKFQELKTGKKLAYVIFGLSDDKKSIVVLKTSENKDFDQFVGELPEKECRWAIYDFEYTLPGGEGIRNKLTFVQWWVDFRARCSSADSRDRSPDDANVKNKMIFASSKDALRRRLDGE